MARQGTQREDDGDTLELREKEPRGGYVKAHGLLIFDHTRLKDGPFRLLMVLRWHVRNPEGRGPMPAQETLAFEMGVERRTIIRQMARLRDLGLLTIERRGQGLTNRYFIERVTDDGTVYLPGDDKTKMSPLLDGEEEGENPEVTNLTHQEVTPGSLAEVTPRSLVDVTPVPHKVDLRLSRSTLNRDSSNSAAPLEKGRASDATRLAQMLVDFSAAWDDNNVASNVTQARTLYDLSGLTIDEFVTLLYDVRTVAQRKAGAENRAAYFFTCLRSAVEHVARKRQEGDTTSEHPRDEAAPPVA